MRHFNYTVLIVAFNVLSACASTYKLSDAALKQRDKMTEEKAAQILAKALNPSDHAGGMCVSGLVSSKTGNSVSTDGSKILYEADYSTDSKYSVQGSTQFGTGQLVRSYKIKRGSFQLDVAALKTIRISETSGGLDFPCKGGKPGYIVVLMPEKGGDVLVNIARPDIDSFMAAMSFFSPNAKIKEGFGF